MNLVISPLQAPGHLLGNLCNCRCLPVSIEHSVSTNAVPPPTCASLTNTFDNSSKAYGLKGWGRTQVHWRYVTAAVAVRSERHHRQRLYLLSPIHRAFCLLQHMHSSALAMRAHRGAKIAFGLNRAHSFTLVLEASKQASRQASKHYAEDASLQST